MWTHRLRGKSSYALTTALISVSIGVLVVCISSVQAVDFFNSTYSHLDIGVYVQNLANIDIQNGVFEADLIIRIRDKNGGFYNGPPLDLPNGGRLLRWDNFLNGERWRLQTTFFFQVTAQRFPFDSHSLHFTFAMPGVTSFGFLPRFSGVSSRIRVPGWTINADGGSMMWSSTQQSIGGDQGQSVLRVSVVISRPDLNSFIKFFLPPTFIILLVMISYMLPTKDWSITWGMITSSLLALVMYHYNLPTPQTGYLTIADQFLTLCYFIILASVVFFTILSWLNSKSRQETVVYLQRHSSWIVWIVAPLVFLMLVLPWQLTFVLFFIPPVVLFIAILVIRKYKQAIKRKREFELANLEQGVVFPEGMFSAEGGGHYWKAYNDEDEQPLYRVMFPGFGAAGQDREGDISTEEDMMSMVSSPMNEKHDEDELHELDEIDFERNNLIRKGRRMSHQPLDEEEDESGSIIGTADIEGALEHRRQIARDAPTPGIEDSGSSDSSEGGVRHRARDRPLTQTGAYILTPIFDPRTGTTVYVPMRAQFPSMKSTTNSNRGGRSSRLTRHRGSHSTAFAKELSSSTRKSFRDDTHLSQFRRQDMGDDTGSNSILTNADSPTLRGFREKSEPGSAKKYSSVPRPNLRSRSRGTRQVDSDDSESEKDPVDDGKSKETRVALQSLNSKNPSNLPLHPDKEPLKEKISSTSELSKPTSRKPHFADSSSDPDHTDSAEEVVKYEPSVQLSTFLPSIPVVSVDAASSHSSISKIDDDLAQRSTSEISESETIPTQKLSDRETTETRNGPFTPLSFSQGDATVVHSTLPPVHPLSIPSNPLLTHGMVSQLHPDKAVNMLSFPRKISYESNTQNLKAQSIPPSDAPSEKQESIPSSSTSRILPSVQFLDVIGGDSTGGETSGVEEFRSSRSHSDRYSSSRLSQELQVMSHSTGSRAHASRRAPIVPLPKPPRVRISPTEEAKELSAEGRIKTSSSMFEFSSRYPSDHSLDHGLNSEKDTNQDVFHPDDIQPQPQRDESEHSSRASLTEREASSSCRPAFPPSRSFDNLSSVTDRQEVDSSSQSHLTRRSMNRAVRRVVDPHVVRQIRGSLLEMKKVSPPSVSTKGSTLPDSSRRRPERPARSTHSLMRSSVSAVGLDTQGFSLPYRSPSDLPLSGFSGNAFSSTSRSRQLVSHDPSTPSSSDHGESWEEVTADCMEGMPGTTSTSSAIHHHHHHHHHSHQALASRPLMLPDEEMEELVRSTQLSRLPRLPPPRK